MDSNHLAAAAAVARQLDRAVLIASSFSDPSAAVQRVTWSRHERFLVDDFGKVGEYPDMDYLCAPTRGGTRGHVAVLMEVGGDRVAFPNLTGSNLVMAQAALGGLL